MSFLDRIRTDELLGRVVRNSAQLFSGNIAALVLSVVSGVLAARLLGPSGYGLIGIVTSYASTINGILSFRMGELVVRYGGQYLEREEKGRAAAVFKLSAGAELLVSAAAFVLVVATAGAATRFAAKAHGIEWMFLLYGVGLLCNFNSETATGVLQVTGKIRSRGILNFAQAAITLAIIVVVYIRNESGGVDRGTAAAVVLLAYLIGKAVLGLGLFVRAWSELNRVLGRGWLRSDTSTLPSLRELFGFAVSSNLSATAILVFRESEVLWVGLLLNAEAAGLYKVAYMIVNLLSVPADPLILSVYPEVNRLAVQRAWLRLKDFLRKITGLAFLYNILLALGLAAFGRRVLAIFGEEYTVAFPAMMVLLAGLAFNYTLFWNRPLLLSFGLQSFALAAIVAAGIVKLGLAIPLVPRYGYVMEALLLSSYFMISVGLIVWRGLRELNRRMAVT